MFWKSKPANLPSTDVLRQKLNDALQLTPHDLELNRQGKLSERQCQDFAGFMQEGQRITMFAVPMVILMCVGIIGFQIATNQETGLAFRQAFEENPTIMIAGIGGSLLLYLGMIGLSMWRMKRMKVADLKVQCLEGEVNVNAVDVEGEARTILKAAGGPLTSYLIKVGRQNIYSINPATEQAFVNGAKYRVYYTKLNHAQYFVSAEVVG